MFKRSIILLLLTAAPIACSAPAAGDRFSGRPAARENPTRNAQPISRAETGKRNYASGQVLVQFKEGADPETIRVVLAEMHLEIIKTVYKPNVYLLKIRDDVPVESIIRRLQAYEAVAHAEPNYIRTID